MGISYKLKNHSPRALAIHVISKGIVIRPFEYVEQNGYLKLLIGQFWEKRTLMGLVTLQPFWSKGTKTFNLRSNELTPEILGSLGRLNHPWGGGINKHACITSQEKLQSLYLLARLYACSISSISFCSFHQACSLFWERGRFYPINSKAIQNFIFK